MNNLTEADFSAHLGDSFMEDRGVWFIVGVFTGMIIMGCFLGYFIVAKLLEIRGLRTMIDITTAENLELANRQPPPRIRIVEQGLPTAVFTAALVFPRVPSHPDDAIVGVV